MRMVRLIIILYGVWNLIVMIVTIVMIVIINIDIQDKLVIMIPLGVIVTLNTPVEVVGIEIIKEINKILKKMEMKTVYEI